MIDIQYICTNRYNDLYSIYLSQIDTMVDIQYICTNRYNDRYSVYLYKSIKWSILKICCGKNIAIVILIKTVYQQKGNVVE